MAAIPTQPPRVITGARALLSVNGTPCGIFTTCSFSVAYDLATINILGRLSSAELVHTGVEPVSINVSGFRIINHGPFADGSMPQVQGLLTTGYFEFTILDRQTGQGICKVHSCKATSFSANVAAKSPMDFSMTYVGLMLSDETADNAEPTGSADLPG